MENWLSDFNHESLSAPEAQESFKSAMGKYKSVEDAVIGGYNAIKATGKPYKLPESLDKLPDDNVRNEFKSQAMKILGVEGSVSEDSLKEINWKKGLSEDAQVSDKLVEAFSKRALEKGYSKSFIQDVVEFNNTFGTELAKMQEQAKQQKIQEAVQNTNKIMTEFYGEDKLKENVELLRRAAQNNSGLSADEYNQIAEDLMDGGYIFQKPALLKLMLEKIAPLAREGHTEVPGITGKTTRPTINTELPKTAAALGWNT